MYGDKVSKTLKRRKKFRQLNIAGFGSRVHHTITLIVDRNSTCWLSILVYEHAATQHMVLTYVHGESIYRKIYFSSFKLPIRTEVTPNKK